MVKRRLEVGLPSRASEPYPGNAPWPGAGRNRAEGLAQVQRSRTAAAIAHMLHALPVGTQRSSAATDAGRAAGSLRPRPGVDLSQPQRFAPVPFTDLRQAAASPEPWQIRSAPFLEHAALGVHPVRRTARSPRHLPSRHQSSVRAPLRMVLDLLPERRSRHPDVAWGDGRPSQYAKRGEATLQWSTAVSSDLEAEQGSLAGAAERWCRADLLACRAL
ncbi:hypothetical protein ACVIJ6_001244 [Bradyrhizobium sp. USDA 4369]